MTIPDGVRKSFRRVRRSGPSKALARLFQIAGKGEMRPMPVVQVNNKKEAQ